jgi:DNA-binding CsgD family transcriptional regulator
MARRLDLSERTINTHVANVYRKLAVSNRVQAVRQAIRLGLVNEPK